MSLRVNQIRAVTALLVGVGLIAASCGSSSHTTTNPGAASKESITIGSASFTENEVLAYVYADALKAAGYAATAKPNVGQRETIQPALDSGQLDATIEYAGNLLSYLDAKIGNPPSVAATVAALKPLVAAKGLTLGNVSQAADSDAIAVTQATATKYHLTSIGDLAPYAGRWSFGGPPECKTRITCVPGLAQYYGVVFKSFKSLDDDGPITHTALAQGDVQAARIFSSDAVIAQDHFVVLADPKNFQGAGNLIPEIRTSKATAGVLAVLNQVSAALTTADLVQMNLDVSVNHDDPTSVASQFVQAHNL